MSRRASPLAAADNDDDARRAPPVPERPKSASPARRANAPPSRGAFGRDEVEKGRRRQDVEQRDRGRSRARGPGGARDRRPGSRRRDGSLPRTRRTRRRRRPVPPPGLLRAAARPAGAPRNGSKCAKLPSPDGEGDGGHREEREDLPARQEPERAHRGPQPGHRGGGEDPHGGERDPPLAACRSRNDRDDVTGEARRERRP